VKPVILSRADGEGPRRQRSFASLRMTAAACQREDDRGREIVKPVILSRVDGEGPRRQRSFASLRMTAAACQREDAIPTFNEAAKS